jgi:hypothetical protein
MMNNNRINCHHHRCQYHLLALFVVFCLATVSRTVVHSFALLVINSSSSHQRTKRKQQTTAGRSSSTSSSVLFMGYDNQRRSSAPGTKRSNNLDRTKRQERVGHVVRTELATLLHRGVGITTPSSSSSTTTSGRDYDGDNSSNGGINEELRRRINIVHANVSPDLRQARVTISVLSTATATATAVTHEPSSSAAGVTSTLEQQRIRKANDAISRRRAYAWLVTNTKSIRHALSKRMSHMKGGAPELTFVQVDVGGAVDVMNLIDKVSNRNYKREMDDGMSFDDMLRMGYDGDYDDEDDEDGWVDDDDDEEDDDEEEDDEDYDDNDDDEDYNDNEGDNTISMSKGKEGVIVEEVNVEQMEMDEEMDDDEWVDFDDVDDDEEEEEGKMK